jgi:predicted dehydrogenase
VRIGFIGAGAIARSHLGILADVPGMSVAAVCDLNEAVAEETAAAAGGAAVYADAEAMLAAGGLDAIFVCTPPGAHLAAAMPAFERGLPVYLEKPLARTAADGEAIVAAWRDAGVVCAVGYQWRSLEAIDRIRAELDGQPPGLVVSRGIGPAQRGRTSSWFEDTRASGGVLFELASHDIDLQRAVAGPVVDVQAASAGGLLATAAAGAPDLHDTVAVVMRFAGGGLGIVALGWTDAQEPPVYSLDVMAADVALRCDLAGAGSIRGRARGAGVDVAGAAEPRRASITRFLDAASGAGQRAVACSPEDALGTLHTVLAAERSVATGERVAVAGG